MCEQYGDQKNEWIMGNWSRKL